MRVLCSCPPLEGLVHPLFPLATALTNAGHDVRVATGVNAHARIQQAGLVPLQAGPSEADGAAATFQLPGMADLSPNEQWRFGVAMFAQIIAPTKLPDLEQIMLEWRPDLVVHVWTDLAAPAAVVPLLEGLADACPCPSAAAG